MGKNAQFFGFVALRYQSGRAANRGALGRAVFAIADDEQRAGFEHAVVAEQDDLHAWWKVREEILRLLEEHLYTGAPIDQEKLNDAGERFAMLNAQVGVREARAFAEFEDSLSEQQLKLLRQWREKPEAASKRRDGHVRAVGISDRDLIKQLEHLYAKSFSWLTGKPEDNEIIPIGQPAQFFGFVSIRHKSGHAASRGKIARSFHEILTKEQRIIIDAAVNEQTPIVRQFLEKRHQFLNQLAILRTAPDQFRTLLIKSLGKWAVWRWRRLGLKLKPTATFELP